MLNIYILISLFVVGVVNTLPVIGLLLPGRLDGAYGVAISGDPNMVLLMQHRALLFGLIGGLVLVSLWQPQWRGLALLLAMLSMLVFMALVLPAESSNLALRRLAWIDLGAFVLALPATVLLLAGRTA